MANTISSKVILDSSQQCIIQVYVLGDGSGEETDTVVVDASALSGATYISSVTQVEWSLNGFSARLEFDATTDEIVCVATPGYGKVNWCDQPNFLKTVAGATGDILLNTKGLGSGDEGTITIRCRKG